MLKNLKFILDRSNIVAAPLDSSYVEEEQFWLT